MVRQAGGQAVKRAESMVGDRQGRQVGRKKVNVQTDRQTGGQTVRQKTDGQKAQLETT